MTIKIKEVGVGWGEGGGEGGPNNLSEVIIKN